MGDGRSFGTSSFSSDSFALKMKASGELQYSELFTYKSVYCVDIQ